MRISDWSSDVCSSDLQHQRRRFGIGIHSIGPAVGFDFSVSKAAGGGEVREGCIGFGVVVAFAVTTHSVGLDNGFWPIFKVILQLLESKRAPHQFGDFCRHIFCRSEEHTSELQLLMRISYAVFYLK